MSKSQPYFSAEYFVELETAIFQNAISATGNPGQIAILQEMYEDSQEAIITVAAKGRRPSRMLFKSILLLASSAEKYNAVSEICEVIAQQLTEAWDDANGGDATNNKLYMDLGPDYFKTNIPSMNAIMYGLRAGLMRKI